ncbi:cytochrome P450 [Echinicola jeungdonensis]|uniref:Cytochrome P450 n=1 Tax=Echinicola jeungdonensis TaxID=709343 RepID=A0ABV5J2G2_9BACT|nr:cytochrome P450 [Echinicola jeungdonensis]MDN3667767.1 cytochrome P450 [Echinicola jeungdonensis]
MKKPLYTSKHPPGPKRLNPFSNLLGFRKDSLGFMKNIAEKYGDIAQFKIGHLRILLLNHPDFIKEVLSTQQDNFVKGRPLKMAKELLGEGLLTSEGDFHKHHSRIMQPAFHRKMMDIYSPVMSEFASRLMNGWKNGTSVDIFKEMVRMSTGIAGKTMFGVDLEEEAAEINQEFESIMDIFGRVTLPFAEYLLKLPLPGSIRFFKAKSRLDKIIYKIIEERRKTKLDKGDLLSLLLLAQETNKKDRGISNEEIRDEALTLLLTAFDTTSLALTWTWYLLSQNPLAEEELHEEVDQVLQGRQPTLDDYPKLKFTKMVFTEAMRLYPPIYVIVREARSNLTIGDYFIPKGTIVLMSPYLIHHDSRFHKDPMKFNPQSWAPSTNRQKSKYEYFPFSEGPRSCIGQHYAWLEGVMVIASISQFWRLKLVPDQVVEMAQLLNLRPKNGILMQLEKRK